jgi:type IV fimbrial biogenesis protein FimT
MIALAVLAILLGIGVPSFNDMVRQNRLAANTNEFLGTMSIARSEAVKRGSTVTICPVTTAAPSQCANNDQWTNGWIVFADETTIGQVDAPGDVIIQRWPSTAPEQIRITNTNINLITYRGDGGTTLAPGRRLTFSVAPAMNCRNPNGARTVTVLASGGASSARVACP